MAQRAGTQRTERLEPDAPERRRRSTDAMVDEMFGRQRTPAASLPDPMALVRNLARCAVEIMAGARDPEQISRWLEPAAYSRLVLRAVVAARARQAKGRRTSMPTVTIGACRIDTPTDDAVEAVIIVHTPARSRAVAMRLIGIDGRWRASELTVL